MNTKQIIERLEGRLEDLLFDSMVINPIKNIIETLNNGGYRNCDIVWLDNNLEKFTKLACQTLGENVITPLDEKIHFENNEKFVTLNEQTQQKYLGYFTTLLNYFKTF